jgi:asparagine synthase (glutamine-hydrolysing)
MSGICGILRFDGAPASADGVERQLEVLAHRGPDRRQHWVAGPVALGHLLLRVSPYDSFDRQPLSDPVAGTTLVADLRLDNRAELIAALGLDHDSEKELPDSAILMRAYQRWGEACATHLLGDFAFAIWDARRRQLVLGRDQMAQRQVFYYAGAKFFAFATEIKALWALPEVPRTFSEGALGRALIFQIEEPQAEIPTIWENIFSLAGGVAMTVDAAGKSTINRYWEPRADPAWLDRPEADYLEGYRAVLGEAVRCRLNTGYPAGLILSGGFDSAAIAAFAEPHLAAQGRRLRAVSSVMPENYRGTIRHCRRWVELCRTRYPNLEVEYITRDGLTPLSGIEDAVAIKDGPSGNYDFVHTELFQSLATSGVRVAMDGHGGDYTINPRGNAFLAWLLCQGAIWRMLREFRAHRRTTGDSAWKIVRQELFGPMLPDPIFKTLKRLKSGSRGRFGSDALIAADFARRLFDQGELDPDNLRELMRPRRSMRELSLRTLRRVMSNSAGLGNEAAAYQMEITRPFHDKRVVEFALAVPENLYVRDGWNRYLARVAMKDLYPPEFAKRWRRNDDEAPDFHRTVKQVEGVIGAQLDRMKAGSVVPRYVDLDRIRELLAARSIEDHNSGWEQETQVAMRGLLLARFVEWFPPNN